MRTYGQEWQTSDVDAVDELVEFLEERRVAKGDRVISTRVASYDSDTHWLLDCENTKPHAHIWMKWEAL